ncbi:MAG TPA: type I phosphomannose isomerase catalytic subunit [Candidatus Limnocylindrales bacterium]|nr:type I phosphomannose isomerase catalytic subunit [Candidatus Limnocylindrales bacterium]
MILCPARLEPIFSPRPWGSLSLAPFFPERSNFAEPLGEAWMTGNECRFANGPYERKSLGDAWPKMPTEWTGTLCRSDDRIPILVKFIFTEQKLSVQVHPDDAYAALHEKSSGGRGKTEMWYALRAQPGAEVMVGLRPGSTKEKFRRAIQDGTPEDSLEHVRLQAGDAMFVPAGTAHTIGPGLVLCEIQEHSDLTYRVYDYNRRDAHGNARELHVEKALDVIRFGEQHYGKITPARMDRGSRVETYFAACRYFATVKWEISKPLAAATSREHFDLLIFLDGRGSIRWGSSRVDYAPMQTWMLPAALGAYDLAPDSLTTLLRTFVPGDLDEFARHLADQGVPQTAVRALVHR